MTASLPTARADSVDAPAVARIRAALQAHMHDPVRWLAYIDALLQSGQPLTARSVLTQALQRGLQGSEVEAMIARVSMLATDGVDWDASACAVPVESVTDGSVAAFWNRQVPDAPEMDRLLELLAQGRHEAVRQQALALTQRAPLHGFGWKLLGVATQYQGRFTESLVAKRRAAVLLPIDAEAHNNLGRVLQSLGHFKEAEHWYRSALALAPEMALTYSNLLFSLSHDADLPPASVFAAHQEFDRRYGQALRAEWRPHANIKDPNKRLRIGFVSGDLRHHAVAHFVEPIWRVLNRTEVEIVAYSTSTKEDAKSTDLQSLTSRWVNVATQTDAQLAQTIRDDAVDILVDLSGHTAHNRLLAFARKPAPVQVSSIGYPNTTGLSAIDYRITDAFRMPPGMDGHYVEKLVRIPCSSTFETGPAPPVNTLPALHAGVFTFGSFQRGTKITDATLRLWCRVLGVVPHSRMLIGAIGDAATQDRIRFAFAAAGVAPTRLVFYPKMPLQDYLALHHQVDILLDSHPYPGGTTTNHGLMMGVPTIARVSDSVVSWQGAATLLRLGLTQWVAHDDDEYVRLAQHWALDLPALAGVRAGMRQRINDNPLRQPKVVAAGMQAAFREMWKRWCAGRPVEAFTVTL